MPRGWTSVDPRDAVVTANTGSPCHRVGSGSVSLARLLGDDADVVTDPLLSLPQLTAGHMLHREGGGCAVMTDH